MFILLAILFSSGTMLSLIRAIERGVKGEDTSFQSILAAGFFSAVNIMLLMYCAN